MMFKDWPRGAALWWRRIPTATSGRAVRESDRMLLGSAHAVPMHVGFSWNGWYKMCINVPSGAALQEPAGGGPRTRREHRRVTRAWAAAASLGRKVARTPPPWKGSQKCWRRIPTETRERSVRESDWFVWRFFDKIVIRNNRHNNISLSIIAIIAISPIIAIKNTDSLTFK